MSDAVNFFIAEMQHRMDDGVGISDMMSSSSKRRSCATRRRRNVDDEAISMTTMVRRVNVSSLPWNGREKKWNA